MERLKKQVARLEKYVMESKEFERKILWAVIGIYAYMAFHIAFWIGRYII